MGCSKRLNIPYLKGFKCDFVWDRVEKITIEDFKKLIIEGEEIPLYLEELEELYKLEIIIDKWTHNANEKLNSGTSLKILE